MRRGQLGLVLALTACAGTAAPPPADAATWRDARELLARLRGELVPQQTRGFRVSTTLREGRTGKTIAARGAIGVRPPDELRMQLVGPAGALALDVWISGGRDRLAIPALDRVERGSGESRAGRPIAFLRWWMLHPLDGDLLTASREQGGMRLVLRSGDGATIDALVTDAARTITVVRRTPGDEETVTAHGAPCGDATYESKTAGVRVEVHCEGTAPEPTARAFDDPDGEPR